MSDRSNYQNTVENNFGQNLETQMFDENDQTEPLKVKELLETAKKLLVLRGSSLSDRVKELNKVLQKISQQYDNYMDNIKNFADVPINVFSYSLQDIILFRGDIESVYETKYDEFITKQYHSQESSLTLVKQFVDEICLIQQSCDELEKMIQEVNNMFKEWEKEIQIFSKQKDCIEVSENEKQKMKLIFEEFFNEYKVVYSKLNGGKENG